MNAHAKSRSGRQNEGILSGQETRTPFVEGKYRRAGLVCRRGKPDMAVAFLCCHVIIVIP